MFLKVVSMIMILPSLYISSLIPPYYIGITILLFISLADTCNNNFGINCSVVFWSMVILIQPLAIGDWKIWGWRRIKLYNALLTCSFIFLQTLLFGVLDHAWLLDIIALRFDLEAHNLWTEVFGLTSNIVGNWRSDFLDLGFFIDTYVPDDIGLFSENPQVWIPWQPL